MILTCIVTCDRLPLTKRCVESYLDTKRPEDRVVVVDNASTDGTRDWLCGLEDVGIILNRENRYPGAATNQGWDALLYDHDQAPLLHRSDNDIEYLPGWQAEVERAFADFPELALLGILNLHEDDPLGVGTGLIKPVPRVGGNVVMPSALYREGLRWSELPWRQGQDEDGPMSEAAHRRGWVARLVPTVANNMAFGRALDFPDYYQRTAAERGIRDWEHSV
jgi:hypothetical protein